MLTRQGQRAVGVLRWASPRTLGKASWRRWHLSWALKEWVRLSIWRQPRTSGHRKGIGEGRRQEITGYVGGIGRGLCGFTELVKKRLEMKVERPWP